MSAQEAAPKVGWSSSPFAEINVAPLCLHLSAVKKKAGVPIGHVTCPAREGRSEGYQGAL